MKKLSIMVLVAVFAISMTAFVSCSGGGGGSADTGASSSDAGVSSGLTSDTTSDTGVSSGTGSASGSAETAEESKDKAAGEIASLYGGVQTQSLSAEERYTLDFACKMISLKVAALDGDYDTVKEGADAYVEEFKRILSAVTLKATTVAATTEKVKAELDSLYNCAVYFFDNTPDMQKYKAEATRIYDELKVRLSSATITVGEAKAVISEFVAGTYSYLKVAVSAAVEDVKAIAANEVESLIAKAIAYVPYEEVQTRLTGYLNEIKKAINSAPTKDETEELLTNVKARAEEKITQIYREKVEELRTAVGQKLNALKNEALGYVKDEQLKNDLDEYLSGAIEKTLKIEDIKTAESALDEIVADTQKFIREQYAKQVGKLKAAAKNKLDAAFNSAVGKVESEDIRKRLTEAYDTATGELLKISDVKTAQSALNAILDEFEKASVDILKTVVKEIAQKYQAKITAVYENAVKPLSQVSKNALKSLYDETTAELSKAETVDDVVAAADSFKERAKGYVIEAIDAVVAKLGEVPQPWSFLPKSFEPKNFVVKAKNIPAYADFTPVKEIPQNYVGKQLNVVYGLLNKTSVALSYVNKVYAALGTAGTVYNTIFDNSDGQNLTLEAGGFTLSIKLDNTCYEVSARIAAVKILVFADLNNGSYGAKIDLTEDLVVKYDVTASKFTVAMNMLNVMATQIVFEKDNGVTTGYVYNTVVAKDKELTSTSALITVKDGYTTIVGNKGDFIPTSGGINCEVYENSTGKFVGSEVYENMSKDDEKPKFYDTLWYNLRDIAGINSVKKTDKQNGLNPDTIYINSSEDTIHTKIVSITDLSRRFDIEFKTVYAYTYNEQTAEYEQVVFEVPMLFIQEKYAADFAKDFEKANGKSVSDGSISISVSAEAKEAVNYGYKTLVESYKAIKDKVTYRSIIDYCKR